MKKLIAFVPVWILFYGGLLVKSISDTWDNPYWVAFWRPVYHDALLQSAVMQDWAGLNSPRVSKANK